MTVLPIAERELRAVARQPLTYNLRLAGVVALVAVCATFWVHGYPAAGAGGRLFTELHRMLFFSIWFLVPFVTADCISRARAASRKSAEMRACVAAASSEPANPISR